MATDPHSFALPKSSWETVASDEILDELHAFREAYAAQFDYDLEKMFDDLQEFGQRHQFAPRATIPAAQRRPPKE